MWRRAASSSTYRSCRCERLQPLGDAGQQRVHHRREDPLERVPELDEHLAELLLGRREVIPRLRLLIGGTRHRALRGGERPLRRGELLVASVYGLYAAMPCRAKSTSVLRSSLSLTVGVVQRVGGVRLVELRAAHS
jgi:hypothetical protein